MSDRASQTSSSLILSCTLDRLMSVAFFPDSWINPIVLSTSMAVENSLGVYFSTPMLVHNDRCPCSMSARVTTWAVGGLEVAEPDSGGLYVGSDTRFVADFHAHQHLAIATSDRTLLDSLALKDSPTMALRAHMMSC